MDERLYEIDESETVTFLEQHGYTVHNTTNPNDEDIQHIVDYLEYRGYEVTLKTVIMDELKREHFEKVFHTYSLEDLQKLLPSK